ADGHDPPQPHAAGRPGGLGPGDRRAGHRRDADDQQHGHLPGHVRRLTSSFAGVRIAYLGPAGTFTEDALRVAAGGAETDAAPQPTVYDAIRAVAEGEADRALVPFENSIEGAVRQTLDTLAFESFPVTIAGEHDHPISHSLIARDELPLERIEVVLSHPQASAQCARFIRESLPAAEIRAAAS